MNGPGGNPKESARTTILARIRGELGESGAANDDDLAGANEIAATTSVPRNYRRHGSLDREACLELFIDRLIDYDSTMLQADNEAELPAAIVSALQASAEHRVIVAAEFPREWLPNGVQVLVDNGASIAEIDSAEAVITTCEVAVASSGTIILRHVGAQGRRAITLLPDHHICLVRRGQVVELLPEALARLDLTGAAPVTTIAGPSATSDIEMTRIRGVHGPRRLTVILYGDARH